ncbi:MAG: GNAT family N-acetyltransferase [Clostridia bacterium]|nr:GNAT family N-acetyltransferase [Clostridia bacterium]
MSEYIIRETTDFLSLSTLFRESKLGVSIEERMPDSILKLWRMDNSVNGNLMAAVSLEIRGGVYCLGDLAVRNDIQSKGYGKIMQSVVFDEAKRLGIKELWVCAKKPEYYVRCGWQKTRWEEAPNIAVYCSNCDMRDLSCHPEILKYTLE